MSGTEVRIIGYLEQSGEGLAHYAKRLQETRYRYAEHLLPHDADVREPGTGKTRAEVLRSFGLSAVRVLPSLPVADGIEQARLLLPKCYFHLDAYLARLAAEGGRKSLVDRGECAHLRAALGPLRAVTVDRLLLGEYMTQARAVGFAPGTLKKRLGYRRAAFYAAKDAGLMRDVPDLPKLDGSPPRQGFYDPADFVARHQYLTGVFADVIERYYVTGWRRDEVLSLEWTQVDRTAGVIRLPDSHSKTGEGAWCR